jgi:hypothetical protein
MRKIVAVVNGVTLYQTQLDIFIIEYGDDIKQSTSPQRAVNLFVECVRHSLLKELME